MYTKQVKGEKKNQKSNGLPSNQIIKSSEDGENPFYKVEKSNGNIGTQDLTNSKIQLKMDVDPQHYSRIIGRGGIVINKIRADHSVFIKFPERNSDERIITISGYEKDAEAAKAAIMEIFVKQDLKNSKIQLKMDVDPQHYPRIIGRGGIVINKIRADHSVFIKFPEPNSDERTITISGYEKDAEAAKAAIMEIFVKQDLKNSKIQLKMDVDPQHYPRIIGRGGVVINKIRADHNVFIKFPERNSDERAITISGYEKDAEAAKAAIMELFVKQRRGSLAGLITKYEKELQYDDVLKDIESTDPELYRELNDILDKLTYPKVGILVEEIKNLDIGTKEKLNVLVNLIYERAIHESNSTILYANVCQRLSLVRVFFGQPGQLTDLRKLFVTKCQKEFEQGICYELEYEDLLKTVESTDREKSKGLLWRFNKEKEKIRFRRIGNIRFIGELFKLNMLLESAVKGYINRLLSLENEISVECACILIKNIASELEDRDCPSYESFVSKYSQQMQNILDKHVRNPRVRFMLKHMIDFKGIN